MSKHKPSLPEVILGRLARGMVPIDGSYWHERSSSSWLDRGRDCSPAERDKRRRDDTD
jgi:hypothetical protein